MYLSFLKGHGVAAHVRRLLRELGGGLGDPWVVVPRAILLVTGNGLSAAAVRLFLGFHYLITGCSRLPLNFANSIFSTPHVVRDYFGERARRVTPRALSFSLGTGNLLGGLYGAMPCCHGAGGLTARYRFGARTGLAERNLL